jgi:hypothetical protein
MIRVIQVWLLTYSILDFTSQIIAQMPMIHPYDSFRYIGFRKIWKYDTSLYTEDQIFSYHDMLTSIGNGATKRTL